MSMNNNTKKERVRSQFDPVAEGKEEDREELYRVEFLWSFHRRLRQRESVTGTERSTEEEQ